MASESGNSLDGKLDAIGDALEKTEAKEVASFAKILQSFSECKVTPLVLQGSSPSGQLAQPRRRMAVQGVGPRTVLQRSRLLPQNSITKLSTSLTDTKDVKVSVQRITLVGQKTGARYVLGPVHGPSTWIGYELWGGRIQQRPSFIIQQLKDHASSSSDLNRQTFANDVLAQLHILSEERLALFQMLPVVEYAHNEGHDDDSIREIQIQRLRYIVLPQYQCNLKVIWEKKLHNIYTTTWEGFFMRKLIQILTALRFLHAHQFVHGCVDMLHVLTEENGNTCALQPSSITRQMPLQGSAFPSIPLEAEFESIRPQLRPPEAQGRTTGYPVHALDVWQMGMSAIDMLSAKPNLSLEVHRALATRPTSENLQSLLEELDANLVRYPKWNLIADLLSIMLRPRGAERENAFELLSHQFFNDHLLLNHDLFHLVHAPLILKMQVDQREKIFLFRQRAATISSVRNKRDSTAQELAMRISKILAKSALPIFPEKVQPGKLWSLVLQYSHGTLNEFTMSSPAVTASMSFLNKVRSISGASNPAAGSKDTPGPSRGTEGPAPENQTHTSRTYASQDCVWSMLARGEFDTFRIRMESEGALLSHAGESGGMVVLSPSQIPQCVDFITQCIHEHTLRVIGTGVFLLDGLEILVPTKTVNAATLELPLEDLRLLTPANPLHMAHTVDIDSPRGASEPIIPPSDSLLQQSTSIPLKTSPPVPPPEPAPAPPEPAPAPPEPAPAPSTPDPPAPTATPASPEPVVKSPIIPLDPSYSSEDPPVPVDLAPSPPHITTVSSEFFEESSTESSSSASDSDPPESLETAPDVPVPAPAPDSPLHSVPSPEPSQHVVEQTVVEHVVVGQIVVEQTIQLPAPASPIKLQPQEPQLFSSSVETSVVEPFVVEPPVETPLVVEPPVETPLVVEPPVETPLVVELPVSKSPVDILKEENTKLGNVPPSPKTAKHLSTKRRELVRGLKRLADQYEDDIEELHQLFRRIQREFRHKMEERLAEAIPAHSLTPNLVSAVLMKSQMESQFSTDCFLELLQNVSNPVLSAACVPLLENLQHLQPLVFTHLEKLTIDDVLELWHICVIFQELVEECIDGVARTSHLPKLGGRLEALADRFGVILRRKVVDDHDCIQGIEDPRSLLRDFFNLNPWIQELRASRHEEAAAPAAAVNLSLYAHFVAKKGELESLKPLWDEPKSAYSGRYPIQQGRYAGARMAVLQAPSAECRALAVLLSQVASGHLVPMYCSDFCSFIALQHHQENLQTLLMRPSHWAEMSMMLLDVAIGLHFLHSRSVAHGFLDPAHVWFEHGLIYRVALLEVPPPFSPRSTARDIGLYRDLLVWTKARLGEAGMPAELVELQGNFAKDTVNSLEQVVSHFRSRGLLFNRVEKNKADIEDIKEMTERLDRNILVRSQLLPPLESERQTCAAEASRAEQDLQAAKSSSPGSSSSSSSFPLEASSLSEETLIQEIQDLEAELKAIEAQLRELPRTSREAGNESRKAHSSKIQGLEEELEEIESEVSSLRREVSKLRRV